MTFDSNPPQLQPSTFAKFRVQLPNKKPKLSSTVRWPPLSIHAQVNVHTYATSSAIVLKVELSQSDAAWRAIETSRLEEGRASAR